MLIAYMSRLVAATPTPLFRFPTQELRSQLLARATGRVLEVGVGTGLNLRHYRRDLVSGIDAVDLSPGMLRQVWCATTWLGRSLYGRCLLRRSMSFVLKPMTPLFSNGHAARYRCMQGKGQGGLCSPLLGPFLC